MTTWAAQAAAAKQWISCSHLRMCVQDAAEGSKFDSKGTPASKPIQSIS